MKIVLQRVSRASVTIDGSLTGEIDFGLLLLVGIHPDDGQEQLEWLGNKITRLRIFDDDDGKMNRSVTDINGGILIVSQFTLYADVRKGTRPGFTGAAEPKLAEKIYNDFVSWFRQNSNLNIQTGVFGAMMDVSLVNDGPVTIVLEK